MSDTIDQEDEKKPRSNSSSTSYDRPQDINRRLSEIKSEIQTLLRQRKKYNDEKIAQDSQFIINEMFELQREYQEMNKQINRNNTIKRQLRAQMSHLRSRSRVRYSSLAQALKDKQRFEDELKRRHDKSEYRELLKNNLAAIESDLPLLKEEAELQGRITASEEAQKTATNRRDKIQEDWTKYQMKRKQNEVLLNESAKKVPILEKKIDQLRTEREELLTLTRTSKKCRKSTKNCLASVDTTNKENYEEFTNESNKLKALAEESIAIERHKTEEKLAQIKTMLSYLYEQMCEHDLVDTPSPSTTGLISPLFPSSNITTFTNERTPSEEQIILPSYMNDSDSVTLSTYPTLSDTLKSPPVTTATKLPRYFSPLHLEKSDSINSDSNEIMNSNLSQISSNNIIYDKKSVEYKKELDNDILNKYGGSTIAKKKPNKKNKRTFAIKHTSQMLQLYNTIRSSYLDTMQSMPMYEYEIKPAIKTLEFIQQSLESYLSELDNRQLSLSSTVSQLTLKSTTEQDQEQASNGKQENEDIIPEEQDEHIFSSVIDSAVEDTYSETSSFDLLPQAILPTLPIVRHIKEKQSPSSSKTATSSPPSIATSSPRQSLFTPSSPQRDHEFLLSVDEDSQLPPATAISLSPNGLNIDRQTSDEGYRSCRGGRGGDCTPIQSHCQRQVIAVKSILFRSKSYDSCEKVDHWLQQQTPSYQNNNRNHQQRKVSSDEYYCFRAATNDDD
ncbi:unnamed protein product [Didymodactylos carnosus]|uniref:Uncharacterized protein n=1 Tax=Didymodactylos carnosus TaxID=1234261 RepID=A0A814C8X7_9BILA|nr:unnamed protein product [Didymodactylos carnosus]CAF3717466.1 unnamed protein product [Didymodactylos carnosus]